MQSNKFLAMQNSLRTCASRKERQMCPKKNLATNVSELLSNQIPVKYKDPGCPTISCTIGQTAINHALLDLGASIVGFINNDKTNTRIKMNSV